MLGAAGASGAAGAIESVPGMVFAGGVPVLVPGIASVAGALLPGIMSGVGVAVPDIMPAAGGGVAVPGIASAGGVAVSGIVLGIALVDGAGGAGGVFIPWSPGAGVAADSAVAAVGLVPEAAAMFKFSSCGAKVGWFVADAVVCSLLGSDAFCWQAVTLIRHRLVKATVKRCLRIHDSLFR